MDRKLLFIVLILVVSVGIVEVRAEVPVQLWNTTTGGTGNDDGYSVTTDSSGNIIVAGYTDSFGVGGKDVWTIKYDSSGNQLWNKTTGGGTGFDYGVSVTTDSSGNIIVAGFTNSFGAGGYDVWTIKYDSNGNQLWNTTTGGTGNDDGYSVTTDSSGNIIVAGYTKSFGAGGADVWTIKYQPQNQISSLPSALDVVKSSDESGVESGSSSGFAAGETVLMKKGTSKIALFNLTTASDYDWSNITADTDSSNGKAFFHIPAGHPEIGSNRTLYIPRAGSYIRICEGASSLNEVYSGCINSENVTSEYVLTSSDPRVSVSGDGQYWIVTGLSGTGGQGEGGAGPEGATLTAGTPQTATPASPGTDAAQGGYTTQLNISGESQTSAWQGYYGEVTGNLTLEDTSGDTLYQWTWSASAGGEVYASRNASVAWSNVEVQQDCTTDESLTGTGSDRVNSTFTNSSSPGFNVGGIAFSAANYTCRAYTYISSLPQSGKFQELLLKEDANPVYATLIENDEQGFDSSAHDYQMIVPEDNRGNSAATNYYFYMELS